MMAVILILIMIRKKGLVTVMNIYEYMEGYDRSFDEDEFDARVWELIQDENFEFDEIFDSFLRDYGIDNLHDFLKTIRRKKQLGKFR